MAKEKKGVQVYVTRVSGTVHNVKDGTTRKFTWYFGEDGKIREKAKEAE